MLRMTPQSPQIRLRRRLAAARDRGRPDFLEVIKYEYESGLTIRELQEALGCSYSTANRLVHDSGASLRPRGGDNRRAS